MKAQGLSLTTIIIAALVLIVLIVLIAVFGGKMRLFGDNYGDATDEAKESVCFSQGGICRQSCDTQAGESQDTSKNWVDCGADEICCKR